MHIIHHYCIQIIIIIIYFSYTKFILSVLLCFSKVPNIIIIFIIHFFFCEQDKDKWAPAELTRWEIFNPDIASTMKNKTTVPTMVSRNPLKNVAYILNETPYLNNLKLALELSQNRPCSFYTKCLYLLQIIFMQKFAAATFLVNIFYFFFL